MWNKGTVDTLQGCSPYPSRVLWIPLIFRTCTDYQRFTDFKPIHEKNSLSYPLVETYNLMPKSECSTLFKCGKVGCQIKEWNAAFFRSPAGTVLLFPHIPDPHSMGGLTFWESRRGTYIWCFPEGEGGLHPNRKSISSNRGHLTIWQIFWSS